jgi:hypothetical protein
MKKIIKLICLGFPLVFFMVSCQQTASDAGKTAATGDSAVAKKDPLPSWNDPLKQEIIDYVNRVSTEGSSDFVPVKDRIATFDNDGTLWAEMPLVQELFAYYRVKQIVTANPALAKKQPFLAVVTKDKAYFEKGGEKALIQLVGATHTGMTEESFETDAKDFFASAVYPGRNVPISKIVYQPQLELLSYLRANGFMTYIVTGGTIELVRAISDSLYGIPKNQVVGTTFKYEYVDSNRSIMREPAIDLLCDKAGKPVGIQVHIGQKPIFSAGNERSSGDIEMSKFCQSNHYPSFQLIVNHNDSLREFYYQEKDSASLKAAVQNKWHIVNMKEDWKTIFPQ